jgi:hypothetical protein
MDTKLEVAALADFLREAEDQHGRYEPTAPAPSRSWTAATGTSEGRTRS